MSVGFLDRVYKEKNIRPNLLDSEDNMIEEVKTIISDSKPKKVKIEKSDKGLIEQTTESVIVMNDKNQQLLKD